MPGDKPSSRIDGLIGELFALLIAGPKGPLIAPRMALAPDRAAQSYFTAASRPRLSADEMARLEAEGLFRGVEAVLDDLPAERRDAVIARLKAIREALAAERKAPQSAEPSDFVYTLH